MLEPAERAAIERELWRAEVAERELGLDPQQAALAATNPLIDVCTARELVRKGCPPEHALQLATRERD
jgi:hypothetical protein